MSTVAILGAGALGGSLAHKLAERNRIRTVRLIDPVPGIAAGKALDIQQARPIGRFHTRVAAGELDAVVGATVVVVTGPADGPDTDWTGGAALALLNEVTGLTRRTPILCAGATHGPLVSSAVRQLGIGPRQILGSAPAALVSGLRAHVALEANASPSDVLINLLGVPPARSVVPWSSATVGGYPLQDRLSPPQLARLRGRVERLWPPGPYTLASVAAQIIETMLAGGSRRAFACFVAEEPSEAETARSVGVTLNADGIASVVAPRLSPAEQVQLDNALA